MKEDRLVSVVKEIGSGTQLLGDFLAKLCLFIAIDNGCDKVNIEFDTTPTRDGKVYTGIFRYNLKIGDKNAKG